MSQQTKVYIKRVLSLVLLSAIAGAVSYYSIPKPKVLAPIAIIQTKAEAPVALLDKVEVGMPKEPLALPTPTFLPIVTKAPPTPTAKPKPVVATPKPAVAQKPAPVIKPITTDTVPYVKQRAASMGWTGAEWDALYFIVTRESSWNHLAVNKSSGACGLFQALPCSKMGTPWNSLEVQTNFGMNYIKNRYGTPLKAKAFWDKNHWY